MKTVIEMAREAGFMGHEDSFYTNHRYGDCKLELERFAELVRADEREACAKVCEEMRVYVGRDNAVIQSSAKDCATSIRARSNT